MMVYYSIKNGQALQSKGLKTIKKTINYDGWYTEYITKSTRVSGSTNLAAKITHKD